jgi:hypothetical protein
MARLRSGRVFPLLFVRVGAASMHHVVLVLGHWDVLRIGSVSIGVWIASGVLIRTGRRLQSSVSGPP